jgi:uncharacterized protein YecE (DUF72 family)
LPRVSGMIFPKVGLCGFTIGARTYYKRYPLVEVQQTFYDPPSETTLERWRSDAPPDFEFTMKAWQVITHLGTSRTYRRLKSPFTEQQRSEAGGFRVTPTVLDAWSVTRQAAEILRATAILFQCPPSFKPTEENTANMKRFFEKIDRPNGIRFLWEPRGKWPDDTVISLCSELALVHTVDPFVRPSLTPHEIYWRLHGIKSHYASYTDDQLHQLVEWLPPEGAVPYVMFNNIPRVGDSKRFLDLITAASIALSPLKQAR